jgi:hypothetical protein
LQLPLHPTSGPTAAKLSQNLARCALLALALFALRLLTTVPTNPQQPQSTIPKLLHAWFWFGK